MNIKTTFLDLGDDDASLWEATAIEENTGASGIAIHRDKFQAEKLAKETALANYYLELEYDDAEMRRDIALHESYSIKQHGLPL